MVALFDLVIRWKADIGDAGEIVPVQAEISLSIAFSPSSNGAERGRRRLVSFSGTEPTAARRTPV